MRITRAQASLFLTLALFVILMIIGRFLGPVR